MDFWRSVGGMVQLRLTSADLETLLTKLNQQGITLYDLRFEDELTCIFRIKREDYKATQKLCTALEVSLHSQAKNGLYWVGKQLLHRPVLVAAFFLLMALVFFLPTRVFFLRVEGNETVPARRILEAAENCGIRFGASRREVRSEKVKNALIGTVPELQWAGVNTRGCVAIISVKERTSPSEKNQNPMVSNIVAVQDGYILSATATKGTLLVQPGQTVTAGQTLISGYSDLGLFIQATAAQGEVYAQTQRQLELVTPSKWQLQRATGTIKKKISLLLGKKRINLWKDSGISGVTCGRMYEECYVTLPGNFVLPVAICVETYEMYAQEETLLEEPAMNAGMDAYASGYLRQQMVAGEILKAETQLLLEEGIFRMEKSCVCHEMIGRQRQEQIGDIHE